MRECMGMHVCACVHRCTLRACELAALHVDCAACMLVQNAYLSESHHGVLMSCLPSHVYHVRGRSLIDSRRDDVIAVVTPVGERVLLGITYRVQLETIATTTLRTAIENGSIKCVHPRHVVFWIFAYRVQTVG